jgi:hypothetical protein
MLSRLRADSFVAPLPLATALSDLNMSQYVCAYFILISICVCISVYKCVHVCMSVHVCAFVFMCESKCRLEYGLDSTLCVNVVVCGG